MKYIKRRLTGPYTTGFISHLLSQRSGLQEFRRLYRGHRDEDRSLTAAGLRKARREIRAEMAEWEAGVEADRQYEAAIIANRAKVKRDY